MGLRYENLDPETRRFMLEEIEMDAASDRIHLSAYLTQRAQGDWPDWLREAAQSGTDDTLAARLRMGTALNRTTMRRTRGGYTQAKVPYNAAEVLAEGEFNRFYVRGLSRRALSEGIPRLEVYRAKAVMQPRPESQRLIGLLVDPDILLLDVRRSTGVETALGVPPGPGSGITVRIPR
ncbi:hypothetical protein MCBMB27_01275 [Methylobacterium phyllosphaerae]|uniref:Uncharacterized protein n=1 Tax=Methylobacterium phyllosphaerae TaxID=418223 RepID=A0AAE8HMK8_9HYPH|nr:hypothetical protein [Methylobacterium phyllosphaerae]APT30566.1 hypothetical protein MCBMB27_01275 [Methylobacterium phyllosphaerae]SFG20545.1 hypothetical protein SAMN05192567_10160 [Methylobacterium phyllosphaerae]